MSIGIGRQANLIRFHREIDPLARLFTKDGARQSGPTFKFVSPIRGHTSILCASDAGCFPWRNSFNYDSDSAQHTPDFILDSLGFGFQEFLQPFKFGD
jgi:hypothetical protein